MKNINIIVDASGSMEEDEKKCCCEVFVKWNV